jgi:NTE family protein
MFVVLLVALLGSSGEALAQAPAAAQRKRVGLALSGGSALGLAHIGVLKWFEENRIPVDHVAGTSMGGLIGGLYASGLSSAEIEEVVRNVDWEQVFAAGTDYRQMSFRRKEDLRDYPNRFELGLRRGFQAPTGLSAGHGVGLLISKAAAPYSRMDSFDDLPTPFRCVATDLVTGKEVVFGKGDLFDAMRSTMSIPGAFAPLRLGDEVLVDGGTLNNIPVGVVQEMGAELVVAVELNDTDAARYEPTSALSVLNRSISVMVLANELRNLRMANLVLSPNLKGLSATDFLKLDELVSRGYQAAARQEQFLRALSASEEEWQAYLAERRARRRSPEVTPQFVQLEGAVGGTQAELERKLTKYEGRPLDPARLEETLTQFTGLGRYNAADYRFVRRNNQAGLLVRLHQKSYGPPILNTVLDIDGAEINNVIFGLGGRITFMDLGGPSSEWRTDFNLGFRNSIRSEYYWRIKGSPLFLAPRLFVDYSRQGAYDGNVRVADYRTEKLGGGMDLGIAAGRSNEFRAGFESSHVSAFVFTGSPTLPSFDGGVHLFRALWQFEGVDGPIVPHNGVRASTEVQWVFSSPRVTSSYPVFESRLVLARQFASRSIFLASLAGGTTAGNTSGAFVFSLGGPFRLSALARSQLIGDNYYYAGFSYLRSLTNEQVTFFGRAYFAVGYELGNAFDDLRRANPFHDGVIGLVAETPLGGVFLGGSIGEQGRRKFFFRVGRLF